MAKYKVKVIKILLKNNKLAKSGEIIDGKMLPDEKGALKGGYVELVKAEKKEVKEVEEDETHDLSTYNKQELIDYAKQNDFEINEADKKADLLKSILSQVSE